MAIECHDADCKYHNINNGGSGPWCDEKSCHKYCHRCGAELINGGCKNTICKQAEIYRIKQIKFATQFLG